MMPLYPSTSVSPGPSTMKGPDLPSVSEINELMQLATQPNARYSYFDAKVGTCCCEIKTQMLQDRLADAQAKNVALEGALNNANQSQYILGQLGRFVAWAGSGSQAAATVAG